MMVFFKKNLLWLIIIFLLSSIFRVFFLNLIEFKSDEATTVYQTVQFFDNPYLIQRGLISGTGVYNFPLFNYVMILLALWSRDPLVLSGMTALINSFLIGLFYLIIKKYYGQMTAIFASLLLAFSPWGVLFSRKIWAQDLINLLFIPFLYFLHELILKKNVKVLVPLVILLMLLIQLHGSGFFLAAATVLVLVISKISLDLKKVLAGVLIGLMPTIPYILFQINSNPPCPDCQAFLRYQQSFRIFDFANFLRPFQIISGLGYHFILGRDYADFIRVFPIINYLKYIFASSFIPILIGLALIVFQKPKYLLLVIYFITIPLLYIITKTSAYMHYFVIIIPVSILLFAISVNTFYSWIRNKFFKILVVAYFLLFVFSNIVFLALFYRFIDMKKQLAGDYGPIYAVTKSYIDMQTRDYQSLAYYQQLRSFASIFAQSPNMHSKMGEFFLEKGDVDLAVKEFNK